MEQAGTTDRMRNCDSKEQIMSQVRNAVDTAGWIQCEWQLVRADPRELSVDIS